MRWIAAVPVAGLLAAGCLAAAGRSGAGEDPGTLGIVKDRDCLL
jgi:hypothetical protein